MTFYDYDLDIRKLGADTIVRHQLRANMKPLPIGSCTIRECGNGWFERTTQWNSRHGRRFEMFTTLDEALASGIKWARRREAQDRLRAAEKAAWQAARAAR
jgi:hypothetical protein